MTTKISNKKNYLKFIEQIELSDIHLVSMKTDNLDFTYYPSEALVKSRTTANYKNNKNQVHIFQRYNLTVIDETSKEPKIKMSCTFQVTFDSKLKMTDEYFQAFRKINLNIVTWPYFRELTHSIIIRMGWPPFIVPIFKG